MSVDSLALDDLILGRGVKRGRHDLPPDASERFRQRLAANGFQLLGIGEIDIEVGQRVPAWLLRPGNPSGGFPTAPPAPPFRSVPSGPALADFGFVFWEVFTEKARRKLFGSEVRNRKGDWEIQLYPTSKEKVFANPALIETYDASRPIGIY